MDKIEQLLTTVVEQQKKQQEQIEVLNRRFMCVEESIRLNTNSATQTLTYTKRVLPYIDGAMRALHEAFRMLANGILNLREETSDFAGLIIDTNQDPDFCTRRV